MSKLSRYQGKKSRACPGWTPKDADDLEREKKLEEVIVKEIKDDKAKVKSVRPVRKKVIVKKGRNKVKRANSSTD